ncbi:hypothetical protein LY78DRAFT_686262 [Colletotrichum sublineola]|nr:hypothetical protein LY78DRAFT_686262 [Colletotrichum sublineola]
MARTARLPSRPFMKPKIDQYVVLIKNLSTTLATFYPELRSFEEACISDLDLEYQDPVTIRCQIPSDVVEAVLALLPKERFTVPSRSRPKLLTACKNFGVDPKLVLFHVGFDYARQSEKFFSALVTLSNLEQDWLYSLILLEDRARTRRTQPGRGHSAVALRRRKGISLNDLESIIAAIDEVRTPEDPRVDEDQVDPVPSSPSLVLIAPSTLPSPSVPSILGPNDSADEAENDQYFAVNNSPLVHQPTPSPLPINLDVNADIDSKDGDAESLIGSDIDDEPRG